MLKKWMDMLISELVRCTKKFVCSVYVLLFMHAGGLWQEPTLHVYVGYVRPVCMCGCMYVCYVLQ